MMSRVPLKKIFLLLQLCFLLAACESTKNAASIFDSPQPSGTGGQTSESRPSIQIVNGNNQNLALGGIAAIPFTVLVMANNTTPAANQRVQFSVVGGGDFGTVTSFEAVTDASGFASVTYAAGTQTGLINVNATAPQGSVTFNVVVNNLSGFSIQPLASGAGNFQTASVNSALPLSFIVQVLNGSMTPAPGQIVRFEAIGARIGNYLGLRFVDVVTDSSGRAVSPNFSLSPTAGLHQFRAYLLRDSSVNVTFSATAIVSPTAPVDPVLTTLEVSSGLVAADGTSVVDFELSLRDEFNNLIPSTNPMLPITLSATPGLFGSTWITSWSVHSPGIFRRRLLVGTTAGVISFQTSVAGVTLAAARELTLSSGASVVNANTSLLTAQTSVTADGTSVVSVLATLRDQFGNAVDLPGQTLVLWTNVGTLLGQPTYHSATKTYRQNLLAPTAVGSGTMQVSLVSINGVATSGISTLVTLNPGAPSASRSTASIPNRTFSAWGGAGAQTISYAIRDQFDNPIPTAGASVTVTKSLVSGTSTGTLGSGPFHLGNGVYQIQLTPPASCSGGPCVEEISATFTLGAATISLPTLRVHYAGAPIVAAANGSYVIFDQRSAAAGPGASSLNGTIVLRSAPAGLTPLVVGGALGQLSMTFSSCTPAAATITDNNNGSYSFSLSSPSASCSGSVSFLLNGTVITGTATGSAASPASFSFLGNLSASHSAFSLSSTFLAGPGNITASFIPRDSNNTPYPNCTQVQVSDLRVVHTSQMSAVTPITCSLVAGVATYVQTFSRAALPDIDFEDSTFEMQYNSGGTWGRVGAFQSFQQRPVNLAGTTIDCSNNPFHEKTIYVNGGTLILNGRVNGQIPTSAFCGPHPLRFKRLIVGPTGVVTHSAASTTTYWGLDIEVLQDIIVEGAISASAAGYRGATAAIGSYAGFGPGNLLGVSGNAPGHGGTGNSDGNINPTYGDAADPVEMGSGGFFNIAAAGTGGHGGGLLRIKAASLHLTGSITANASSATGTGGWNGGCGGSGGAIKIDLRNGASFGAITGGGAISANGGNHTLTSGINCGYAGSAGGRIAIYADLRSYAGALPSVLSGNANNSSFITRNGSLYLARSPSTINLNASLILGTNASYFGPVDTVTKPNLILFLGQQLNFDTLLEVNDLQSSGTLNFMSSGRISARSTRFLNFSTAFHDPVSSINYGLNPAVSVTASEDIILENGSTLNVQGRGYPGDSIADGLGLIFGFISTTAGPNSWHGGNHFRPGGNSSAAWTFGSLLNPNSHGGSGCGLGSGGGLIKLNAGRELVISGTLQASGTSVTGVNDCGGAGGALLLRAPLITLNSSNLIQAAGGSASTRPNRGGGAGGIITFDGTLSGTPNTSVLGGAAMTGGFQGQSGDVSLFNTH